MKDNKQKKQLTWILFAIPFVFFAINHLLFCYGNISFNMNDWSDNAIASSSVTGGFLFFCGIIISIAIYANKNDLL